jgi:hypothetical protein
VLLRHVREPSIGCLVLGEGNEDDQVRVQSLMAGQLHERTRDLGPDLPFPVLHELLELRLLAWLEGGMGNRSEHEDPPLSLMTRIVINIDAGTIPSIDRFTVGLSEQMSRARQSD